MSYVVFENDPTSRARVHRSTCGFYINREERTLDQNRWHLGPYTRQEAFDRMKVTGKADTGACGHCNP